MNWTRKHSDKDPKHRKEWRAGRGRYRIVWRDKAFGVTVPPGYQCCMRIFVSELGQPMWEFVDRTRKPLYRTFQAAKNACEQHADPDYKPVKKKRKKKKKGAKPSRKAPMKTCPECAVKLHVRKRECECSYKFPKKVKRPKR